LSPDPRQSHGERKFKESKTEERRRGANGRKKRCLTIKEIPCPSLNARHLLPDIWGLTTQARNKIRGKKNALRPSTHRQRKGKPAKKGYTRAKKKNIN